MLGVGMCPAPDIWTCPVQLCSQGNQDERSNPLTENHIRVESKRRLQIFSLAGYSIVPQEVFCESKAMSH